MSKGHYPFIICTAPHQRDLLQRLPSALVAHFNNPPGTPPRPSHRPPTWPPSSAGSSSPQDFGHLSLTSQPSKKSTSSAWPGKNSRHNRESRENQPKAYKYLLNRFRYVIGIHCVSQRPPRKYRTRNQQVGQAYK